MIPVHLFHTLLICLLSASLTSLLTLFSDHCQDSISRARVYAASAGLLLFECVKGMLIDCGWEFAALMGVTVGMAAQLSLILGTLLFFRELRNENWRRERTACAVSLLCFGTGSHLLSAIAPWPDVSDRLIGEALTFAVVTVSIMRLHREDETDPRLRQATAAGASLLKALFCSVWRGSEDAAFLGAVLLSVGLTGMLCACGEAMQRRQSLSPGGFAAGFLTALCIASLPLSGNFIV